MVAFSLLYTLDYTNPSVVRLLKKRSVRLYSAEVSGFVHTNSVNHLKPLVRPPNVYSFKIFHPG